MKTYELKTKGGEVINKVNAKSIEEAVEILAGIKKLTIDSLVGIYDVETAKNK